MRLWFKFPSKNFDVGVLQERVKNEVGDGNLNLNKVSFQDEKELVVLPNELLHVQRVVVHHLQRHLSVQVSGRSLHSQRLPLLLQNGHSAVQP